MSRGLSCWRCTAKARPEVTQNAAAIETNKDLDASYLWQYLRSQYNNLRGDGVHGQIAHLNLSFVKQLKIPLYDLKEQQRIVSILSLIDEKIELSMKLQIQQERLKHALIQDLFTGKVQV
jgi:restriction endonuclease S subunit